MTTGAGAVWQTDFENDYLLRIDPVAGKVVASIPVGSGPEGVAVTAGAVWVVDEHDEAVTRVDPKTNRVVATIPIGQPGPAGPQIMTAGPGGGVWVGVPNLGEVDRIDPATNSVGLRVPLDGPVASDGAQVWIGVEEGPNGLPEVVRIDPVSGKVLTTVHLDAQGIGGLAVGLGSVWVSADGLTRIDAATGRIVGRLDIGSEGGNVTVRCLDGPEGRMRVEVSDGGYGIRSELIERLFVPFDRLEAEATGVEGTGLGLALSKGLVEAMGGTLEVASELGRGSTFSVELPCAPDRRTLERSSTSRTTWPT